LDVTPKSFKAASIPLLITEIMNKTLFTLQQASAKYMPRCHRKQAKVGFSCN
jgi:hypothetical protein